MKKKFSQAFCCMLAMLLCAFTSSAETKLFIGESGSSWETPENWSPAGVPTDADAVYIPEGIRVAVTNEANMSSLVISNNAAVSVFGSTVERAVRVVLETIKKNGVENYGRYAFNPDEVVDISVNAKGDVSLLGSGQLIVGGFGQSGKSEISVGGDMTLSGSSAVVVYAGKVTNYWETASYGAHLKVAGELKLESGTELELFGDVGAYINGAIKSGTAAPVFVEAGKLTVAEGASILSTAGLGHLTTAVSGTRPWASSTRTGEQKTGGGGYGGKGGDGAYGAGPAGAAAYGSDRRLSPIYPGGHGRATVSLGGGVVWIKASEIVIDGTVSVTPTVSLITWESGGGAGGSVFLSCDTFSLGENGLISANGRKGYPSGPNASGGGGGGRIAVAVGLDDSKYEELATTGTLDEGNLSMIFDMTAAFPGRVLVDGGEGVASGGYSGSAGDPGEALYFCIPDVDKAYSSVGINELDVADSLSSVTGVNILQKGSPFSSTAPEVVYFNDEQTIRRRVGGYTVVFADGTVQEGTGNVFAIDEVTEDFSLLWNFTGKEYVITAVGEGSGTVSPSEQWGALGSEVEFAAVPGPGAKFLIWSAPKYLFGAERFAEKITLPVEGNLSFAAVFSGGESSVKTYTGADKGLWTDGNNWEPLGVPDAFSDVLIPAGKKVSLPQLATVKSLTLEDGAFLSVFGKNCVLTEGLSIFCQNNFSSSLGRSAANANASEYAVVLNVLGDVVMKGASSLAVGGFDMLRKAVFYVGGDLTVGDTSTLAVYPGFPSAAAATALTLEEHIAGGARLDVTGNLTVSSGAKLQLHNHHTRTTGLATLHPVIVTAKKVTVEEGARVESLLGGEHHQNQMRSLSDAYNTDSSVKGAGHGGIGGGSDGTATTQGGYRAYDNMYAPLYPGAYGRPKSGVGGGTIRIHADFVKIAGVLDVSAKQILATGYEMGGSAGGSIWITSRGAIQVTETAELLALGQDGYRGNNKTGGRGGGGGGRIALCRYISDEKLFDLYATGDTEKTKKFDIADEEVRSSVNFSGSIDVSGGLPALSGQAGGVGTAYLLDGREVGFSVIIR